LFCFYFATPGTPLGLQRPITQLFPIVWAGKMGLICSISLRCLWDVQARKVAA
jgi:hypothetical protein